MNWLLFAPAPNAHAETLQGLRIAERLTARGDQVLLLHRDKGLPSTHPTVDLERLTPDEPAAPRLRAAVDDLEPTAIVCCDLLRTALALEREEAHDALDLPLPVIGIDPWDLTSLHGELDPFPDGRLRAAREIHSHVRTLRPSPFITPDGMNAANMLPNSRPLTPNERASIRARNGWSERPVAVLVHEWWQHRDFGRTEVRSLRNALPILLEPIVETVGLQIVEFGPRPLYKRGAAHTRDPEVIGAADLVLSTSAMSPWNAEAAARAVPIVTLVHSGLPTPLLPWAFRAWPASFDLSLRRLLRGNPWADVLNCAELGEPEQLIAKLEAFLPDSWAREGLMETSHEVVARIRALPSPEIVLDRLSAADGADEQAFAGYR